MRARDDGDGPVSLKEVLREVGRADGRATHSTDLDVATRSLPGAVQCVLSFYGNRWNSPFPSKVEDALTQAAGQRFDLWEEAPGRTHAEICAVVTAAMDAT